MNIKMRYLPIIAVGMLVTANSAVNAKDIIKGVGVNSCGEFLYDVGDKDITEAFPAAYSSWAHGFLSAENGYYSDDVANATDLSDLHGHNIWIKNYCEENPLRPYYFAVKFLWDELRHQQNLPPDPRF